MQKHKNPTLERKYKARLVERDEEHHERVRNSDLVQVDVTFEMMPNGSIASSTLHGGDVFTSEPGVDAEVLTDAGERMLVLLDDAPRPAEFPQLRWYNVEFCYNTDSRCSERVLAENEVDALREALDRVTKNETDKRWVTGEDNHAFHVRIKSCDPPKPLADVLDVMGRVKSRS